MAHSKTIQFYRNSTVVRPDTQNNKTAFTVAKESFDSIDNVSDGEAVFVRYQEGDNDPVKTIVGVYHLNGNVGSWTLIQNELVSGDNIKTINNESLLGSGNIALPTQLKVGSVAGKLYRNDVNGGGNFTVKGNSGCIPNLTAGTFLVAIYAKSATQSYTFRFNFGSVTYDLSTTNGEIIDTRTVTISSASTFSGSVLNGSVASGTILYLVMYNYLTPATTVGPAAVTNRYADLDGTPSLATVATSGSYSDLSGAPTVANNLTTTESGSVLDARQGKELKDLIDGKISTTHPANSITSQMINDLNSLEDAEEVVAQALSDLDERITNNDRITSDVEERVGALEDGLSEVTHMTEVTHAELLQLKYGNNLIPGMNYRITDYVATTTLQNTRSGNHPFDVVVMALDESTLCEDAHAIRHEGDTYFGDCNLSAWELKYDIDGISSQSSWYSPGGKVLYTGNYDNFGEPDEEYSGVDYDEYYIYVSELEFNNSTYSLWRKYIPSTGFLDTYILTGHIDDDFDVSDDGQGAIVPSYVLTIDNDELIEYAGRAKEKNPIVLAEIQDGGKGVIYYMKDEFGNSCYYDFKGIEFFIQDQSSPILYNGNYYYTFSLFPGYDASTQSWNRVKNVTIEKSDTLNFITFTDIEHISNIHIGNGCRNIYVVSNVGGASYRLSINGFEIGDNCVDIQIFATSVNNSCIKSGCNHQRIGVDMLNSTIENGVFNLFMYNGGAGFRTVNNLYVHKGVGDWSYIFRENVTSELHVGRNSNGDIVMWNPADHVLPMAT